MAGRQATGTRQVRKTEIARQVRAQHLLCPPLLPGCQTSPTVLRPELNGAIGPGQMGSYSPCSVVDKQLVRLAGSCERGKQRQREILQNDVDTCKTDGAVQLSDRRTSFLGRDLIKCGLGDTEVYNMKRASDVGSPCVPHVVDMQRTG